MNHFYKTSLLFKLFLTKLVFLLSLILSVNSTVKAQCPFNIDFEEGAFNGWQCWTGSVNANTGINLNPVPGPVANRHEMLSANPGNGFDPYGDFPKNCPNGSGHSIKLGNNSGGAQAEGVSYDFTIPANANEFSLIYYYAVVFQDPGHQPNQQPRLEIEITNLTDNTIIGCSSFSFIASSGLPGFFQSAHPNGNTPVWCKDWSATSINLDGNQGKTIRLFFKTADCTFQAHFGYAYIDVNTECSSSFVGATFCPDDTAITVQAPFGYQAYTWYNSNYTQLLGTGQSLYLNPPPLAGSVVNVQLTPYNGYGCLDTLTAVLWDTLTVTAFAGTDKLSCDLTPVQLGGPPKQGLVYSWSPAAGLSNPNISNPIATPTVSTSYVLTVTNSGGGCLTKDTVQVNAGVIDISIQLIGSNSFCTGSGQSAVLQVNPADGIQWFKDNVAIPGATLTQLTITQTGDYHAVISTNTGCSAPTQILHIDIYPKPTAGFTINNISQCFATQQFVFTNTSSVSSGTLQYAWSFGDGTVDNNKDVTHTYTQPGTYTVKLIVTAAGQCTDSISYTVTLLPTPTADFASDTLVCVNLLVPITNKTINNTTSTINYLWNFGNGQTSTQRNPGYSYLSSGTYTIKLSVSSSLCPATISSKQVNVVIDAPVPGINYPAKDAVLNFPEPLQARQIGTSILWVPSTNLDNNRSFTPFFKGLTQQLYRIEIKNAAGCLTIDTQLVKTHKKIEIYVPTIFTPGTDGKNDLLRPLLMGFVKVNYFRIYNRWGNLLFEMKSDRPGWDGKVNNVPVDLLQTVVWMIEAVDVDGVTHRKQGTTIMMR